MPINQFSPYATPALFEAPATSLSRLAAAAAAKRIGTALASSARSGANTYMSGDIRVGGARFAHIWMVVSVASGTATLSPQLQINNGGTYYWNTAPTGRNSAGSAGGIWGPLTYLAAPIDSQSIPCMLPDIIRIGVYASDTSSNTFAVYYTLGF